MNTVSLKVLTWISMHRKTAILLAVAVPMVFVLVCNAWIIRGTAGKVYTSQADVPSNRIGLVLGAGVRTWDGVANPHFEARIAAAAALYRYGKVQRLLLSGDNHSANYDEPEDMRQALIERGVPDSAIAVDDAGFRTLDSVARAREVFGIDSVTIITDRFHAYRAVFLARHFGLDACAFCCAEVPFSISSKPRFREIGARVVAVLDVFVLRTKPRFLGPPITV